MKKTLLVVAAVLLLTVASVPSFADGDPIPHKAPVPQCRATVCLPPA